MFQRKTLSILIGCTFVLAGCGGGSSSSDSSNASQNVIVTAMDGYLSNADLYALNENGICLSDETKLGTTDTNGQASIDPTLLNNGFCVVTTTETIDQDFPDQTLAQAYTLYSPTPRLLENSDAPVVSPFTTYLHDVMQEAKKENADISEQDILTEIADAKTELANALGLDGSDEAIQDLLTTDYVKAKTDQDAGVKSGAEISHAMAQLLVKVSANSEMPNAQETVNIAKSAVDQLSAISSDLGEDASVEKLEDIAVYVFNNIEQFSEESNVTQLKQDIDDDTKLAKMPSQLDVTAEDLSTQLTAAITAAAEASGDNSVALKLSNLELMNISDQNLSEGDTITHLLRMKKSTAVWDSEVVANTADDSAAFSNNTLTIKELTFNQYGKFDFELLVKRDIEQDGKTESFESMPIAFSVDITDQQVANAAPVFVGMEDANAQQLIATLNTEAQDPDSFSDELNLPDFGIFLPAEFTLKYNIPLTDLEPLFSDGDTTPTINMSVNSNDLSPFFMQIKENYNFTSDAIEVPQEDSVSYDFSMFAVDSLGAKSDKAFTFTVTVNSDKTAQVTQTGQTNNGDNGGDGDTDESFLAVMLTPNQRAIIADTILNKLGQEFETPQNVNIDQIFQVTNYTCNAEGACERGSTADNLAVATMSDSRYITLESDGTFSAVGADVTETETVTLSATYDGQAVKIYEVDADYNLVTNDLDRYSSQITLTISQGPNVEVALSN